MTLRQIEESGANFRTRREPYLADRRNLFDTRVEVGRILPNLGKPLLLGEWCHRENGGSFENKEETLSYHWDDRDQLYRDWDVISSAVENVLPELVGHLNELHRRNLNTKGWEIIFGYWLFQLATVTLDRLRQLERANQSQKELFFQVDDGDWKAWIPKHSRDAQDLFENDAWNNHFLHDIVVWSGLATVVPTKGLIGGASVLVQNRNVNLRALVGEHSIKVLSAGLQVLKRKSAKKFVVGESSLNTANLLRLVWQLPGRVDVIPRLQPPVQLEWCAEFRNWALSSNSGLTEFERLFRLLIPKWMPMVFLEGFASASRLVTTKFPKKPDVIFTTTSHFHDSYFKIWSGQSIAGGAKLVIGQHGHGAPGKFNGTQRFDLSVADLYLGSGSVSAPSSTRKEVGQFWSRIPIRAKIQRGQAVLVTCVMPQRAFDMRSMPIASQTSSDILYTQRFFRRLPERIQKQTRVRVYPFADYRWDQVGRWRRTFPKVRIDNGTKTLSHSMRHARLAIVAYQASVYAETLAANIPTVAFWDETLWEISETARQDFDLLEGAGIFHRSPESAAEHVSKIWPDVDEWWRAKSTQEAREIFCSKYADRPSKPIAKLARAIDSVTSV